MILRKPYAFLIKKFRIIHILLVFLSVFVLNQTRDIYTFFSTYISDGYSAIITNDFAKSFVNSTLFFAVLILIGILLTVKILFTYKKKKEKVYFISIIYYSVLIGFFIFYYSVFKTMENDVISANTARVYNDISFMIYMPQYIFILFYSVRALGFNVKKFNFKDDLKEMNLEDGDNDEVELNIEFDSYKTKRGFRRFLREMRYYIQENLIFFIIICSVLTFTIAYNIVTNLSFFKNNYYDQGESFYYEGLYITIENAVISNTDEGGDEISTGKYILALTVNFENRSTRDYTFDINDYRIIYNDTLVTPSNQYANIFSDYGSTVYYSSLKYSSSSTYVLTYQIDKEDIYENFTLKLFTGTYVSGGVTYPLYNIIDIEPNILKEISIDSSYSLNSKLDFTSTNIGSSYITIEDYEIGNLFYYEYEKCIKDVCTNYLDSIYLDYTSVANNKSTILALTADISLDNTTIYYYNNKSYYSFFDNFVKVSYTVDGVNYTSDVTAISKETNDGKYYIVVPNKLAQAETINLIFTIRNKEYTYKIK